MEIPNTIDFAVLTTWLERCKNEHQEKCDNRDLPPRYWTPADIILVDVIDGCLVRKTTACSYFALSYVWGGVITTTTTAQNFELFQQSGYLWQNTVLPETVCDAMVLTREMGIRYLWVDCLSIVQDSATKHEEIKNMDVIFSKAELTIVAAGSKDAWSHLPGVKHGTRKWKASSSWSREPSRYDFLQDTTYNSRGWYVEPMQL